MTAVVTLSGGMDSATALGWAVETHGHENVHAISFLYGQRHEREIVSARALAEFYNLAAHKVVQLPTDLFQGAGSALIPDDNVEMPHKTYEELAESEGPSITYVPFRNANIISMATAYALTVDANEVWASMHAEDANGFAYPDCTPEFIGGMSNAMYVGTYHKVRLITPFQWMNKAQIAQTGYSLGVPFEKTWSCYEGGDRPCGKCPTCVGRLEAFAIAGLLDPVEYEIPHSERSDYLSYLNGNDN
jgi:7-cyano-7-deazaguanine synthase